MSAVLDTPELLDRAEISAGKVLVEYTRTEAALAELRARHGGATFDLTTTAGDKAARAARLELVTLRTSLEKRRKEFKAPAIEFGKKIDAEAARITAEIEALEKPIDAQIRADELRREEERQERARLEAERVAGHRERIAAIRDCANKARGISSSRIANGIAAVEALTTDEANYQEFAREAADAKAETIATMRTLFDAAKAAEDAAAAQEAQRIELARVAEAQRLEAARLDEARAMIDKAEREAQERIAAERAELDRQRADVQRIRAEEQAKAQREAADAQRIEAARLAAAEPPKVEPQPVMQSAAVLSDKPIADANARAFVDRIEPATLKLGTICERLGFTVTAAFVTDTLGIAPSATDKAAKLFKPSDFARICAALQAHISAAYEKFAA